MLRIKNNEIFSNRTSEESFKVKLNHLEYTKKIYDDLMTIFQ